MEKIKARGLLPDDDKTFDAKNIKRLQEAQIELQFLLDRGYPMKSACTFVCNHHQLSERHAMGLTRATATSDSLLIRNNKQLDPEAMKGQTLYIDGFNLIITLEVALSDGMLFIGQDGCIRDAAHLRGSYRIIPQTHQVIEILRDELQALNVAKVIFMLDEPISNSGRLKETIYEPTWEIPVEVQIVRNPDALLKDLSNVISSDAVILDECKSWYNLPAHLFEKHTMFSKLSRLIKLNNKLNNSK